MLTDQLLFLQFKLHPCTPSLLDCHTHLETVPSFSLQPSLHQTLLSFQATHEREREREREGGGRREGEREGGERERERGREGERESE